MPNRRIDLDLNDYIVRNDLTIAHVAAKLHRHYQTIWKILHGVSIPNRNTEYRIRQLIAGKLIETKERLRKETL